MPVVTLVLSILLALVFAAAGTQKALRAKTAVANAEHLGYSVGSMQLIGGLEIAAAAGLIIGLFWTPLGIAAATGLVLLMIGAVVSHARVKDKVAVLLPAAVLALVSAATVAVQVVNA
jgi:uncharacterized membrane protein YphA (DoxX/SURF4 family)